MRSDGVQAVAVAANNSSSVRGFIPRSICLTNPPADSFDVIVKNIRKLSPAGGSGQIRLDNKRTDFRICYFHAESLVNFYNLSMLKCSRKDRNSSIVMVFLLPSEIRQDILALYQRKGT